MKPPLSSLFRRCFKMTFRCCRPTTAPRRVECVCSPMMRGKMWRKMNGEEENIKKMNAVVVSGWVKTENVNFSHSSYET